jgi:hypothetical protein
MKTIYYHGMPFQITLSVEEAVQRLRKPYQKCVLGSMTYALIDPTSNNERIRSRSWVRSSLALKNALWFGAIGDAKS